MGRWLRSCCCICGDAPEAWEDRTWALTDFCPEHAIRVGAELDQCGAIRPDWNLNFMESQFKTVKHEDRTSHSFDDAESVNIEYYDNGTMVVSVKKNGSWNIFASRDDGE